MKLIGEILWVVVFTALGFIMGGALSRTEPKPAAAPKPTATPKRASLDTVLKRSRAICENQALRLEQYSNGDETHSSPYIICGSGNGDWDSSADVIIDLPARVFVQ